jgi:hypothetical protein
MARSSKTSTDNTAGVSRFPNRPRSEMTLEMIPEEDTVVTPARASVDTGPHPNNSPATIPGTEFSTSDPSLK